MQRCLEEALRRYPYNGTQKQLLHVDLSRDFQFRGIPVLMQHVVFNLLKNSIYYVLDAGKGSIHIWMEQQTEVNCLHFKDTGKGINSERLPYVFERFYSNRHNGTGIGLAFCKQVITQFGGSISCDSIEGEYTHFTLRFPRVEPANSTK